MSIPNEYPTLNFGLGETADQLRQTVRAFANKEVAPIAAEIDKTDEFPRHLWPKMGDLGLHGITVEEEYGGSGLGYLEHCIAVEEVSRASAAVGLSYGAHSNLCVNQIRRNGTDAQKKQYLPKLISGEHVGSLAMSESGAGSDVVSMQLRAEKKGDRYILNGTKMWITNSPLADVFLVWAKFDNAQGKTGEADTIHGFILEKGMKGLSAPKIEGKMSLRASTTGEIVMNDVFVPTENLLPNASGLKGPFGCLNKARYGIAWGALGAAEDCWLRARQYTLERVQFGRPLAQTQLIQTKLVDMQSEIALGLQAALRVGRLLDEDRATHEMISLIKRNSCGKALDIARMARDMHGANGVHDEYHVMRHMINLESVNTYEGTHDVHGLILGRAQTGLQAFS